MSYLELIYFKIDRLMSLSLSLSWFWNARLIVEMHNWLHSERVINPMHLKLFLDVRIRTDIANNWCKVREMVKVNKVQRAPKSIAYFIVYIFFVLFLLWRYTNESLARNHVKYFVNKICQAYLFAFVEQTIRNGVRQWNNLYANIYFVNKYSNGF